MSMINILALAIALAMDAFAVSIAIGMTLKEVTFRHRFRLSWHFGFFQSLMTFLGWLGGVKVKMYIDHYDHWVAFVLLMFVSGHMILEIFKNEEHHELKRDPTKGSSLIVLSLATSIDALAVGFSISILEISIVFPVFIIGVVALLFTLFGMKIGRSLRLLSHLSRYAHLLGGVILLFIGLNILREHGVFNFIFQ